MWYQTINTVLQSFFSFNNISSSSLHVSAHADIHIEKVLQKDVGQIVITSRGERDLRDG